MNLNKLIFTENACYKAGRKIKVKGIMVHSTGANNPYLKRYVCLLYTSLQMDDELIFSASERKTTSNGQPFQKEGFYSYSAAWDSKHKIELPEGKSARVLFTLQQMEEGGEPF